MVNKSTLHLTAVSAHYQTTKNVPYSMTYVINVKVLVVVSCLCALHNAQSANVTNFVFEFIISQSFILMVFISIHTTISDSAANIRLQNSYGS